VVCSFVFLSRSRGANYIAQVLLRPGASDLTGSFRLGTTTVYLQTSYSFTVCRRLCLVLTFLLSLHILPSSSSIVISTAPIFVTLYVNAGTWSLMY